MGAKVSKNKYKDIDKKTKVEKHSKKITTKKNKESFTSYHKREKCQHLEQVGMKQCDRCGIYIWKEYSQCGCSNFIYASMYACVI